MPLTLFDDLLLHFRNSPAVENKISERSRNVYNWFNSHRQLVYRITHGLAEVVHLLSIHSPVQGRTNIGAEQPELDEIFFVGHGILPMCEPCMFRRKKRGNIPGSWQEGRRRSRKQPWRVWHLRAPWRDSGHRWPCSTWRGHHPALLVVGICLSCW